MIEFAHKTIEPGMIFLLREMSPKEMSAERERSSGVTILHRQDDGVFEWFVISSGPNVYEVTRLGYFAHCTCKGFEYGHNGCKHVAVTLPLVCPICLEKPVKHPGQKCMECFHVTEGFMQKFAARAAV